MDLTNSAVVGRPHLANWFLTMLTGMSLLLGVDLPAIAQVAPVISTFETGDEGWTAVDLGGDYRDIYLTELVSGCQSAPAGVLSFCDPDAGEWMFSAPEKFLGNKAAFLDGYIQFSSRDNSVDGSWEVDHDPYPDVVLRGTNIAVVRMGPTPVVNEWTTYRYDLNERGQWAWVDGEFAMSELPLATPDQIRQVLTSLTAILIRGEVITGDDQGWLANVTLAGPQHLVLSIRALSSEVELSWPATATDVALESRGAAAFGMWTTIDHHGTNVVRVPRTPEGACFRLRRL
jgi:hypothetical protein